MQIKRKIFKRPTPKPKNLARNLRVPSKPSQKQRQHSRRPSRNLSIPILLSRRHLMTRQKQGRQSSQATNTAAI